ncbi:MAG: phage antirepressor protein [Bacilli bacterium]|nr:phage antirepressor protein [Bacilli bacterium]
MHLINKMFNDKTIRTVWNKDEEKYYISVIDIVNALMENDYQDSRNYWKVLKHRLKKEGNETVTNCNQLKLKAQDGKYRSTDVVDIEGIFRIIESIPSPNAEPMKLWLARLGKERIDEVFDPSITVQRAIDTYRTKGYDEDWIIKRIKGIQDRKKLTDVWNSNGVTEEVEYAILTNEIYKEWSGLTAKQYKQYKGLRKESLRDNMTDIEVALADLGEIATRELAKKHRPLGLEQNKKVAKMGGHAAKVARDDIEKNLGETVVSKDNALSYKYVEDDLMIENKE